MTTRANELLSRRQGSSLVLTLNRPEARNALTGHLIRAIGDAVIEAENDPEIRAIVLTASGDRAFCAGMDLRSFAEGGDIGTGDDPATTAYYRLTRGETAMPAIGAVNGVAIGGGLELLLGCDLIVATAEARFGLPEAKRGLFPGGGGTGIGTRIPLSAALEMTLTGEFLSAQRAFDLGLVNAVVAADDLVATALDYAGRVGSCAPLSLAACKELVRLAVTDPSQVTERLSHWQSVVFTSEDAIEGATAFMQKRQPRWKGR
ncbi:enoyl-CoA hydratase/isomerase family protein [Gordonia rhizosphera]|uniref:Putative enoyl-CoA hydratase n=1 Tax=Gordonia rhizosphera NBRC 16068 TaxID=1108045 RepID=K6WBU6_9ACTN|nr:enoyl-CoA hydratase-related protein [Gordonia rhizosphera]GAB89667.1 putative enoyl-CoA hydratase [Gordonia rhizosphera NBRC 16068]